MTHEAHRYAYERSGFNARAAGPHAATQLKACLSSMATWLCGASSRWCALAYNEVILDVWRGGGWHGSLPQMVRAIGIAKGAAEPALKLARELHSAALADGVAVPLLVYDCNAEREPFSLLPPAPPPTPAPPPPSPQPRTVYRLPAAIADERTAVCSPWATGAPKGSWHPYLFPKQMSYHPNSHYCERRPADLGIDGAWLPVTHTRDRTALHSGGVWLYYARGCSDLLWHMGRTLLARNRAHSAILIEQRLGGGSDLEAAERVVAWMKKHNEVGLLQRGAQFFGRPVYNPAYILGGAARGILGEAGCMVGEAFWSNGSLRVCSCASTPKSTKRLFAMSGIIGNGALQMYAEAALATLRARGGLPWDTLQLSEQMQGHGSRSWAIEIWDVRYLPEQAPSILSLENRTEILRRHVLRASGLCAQNGSSPQPAYACEPSNVTSASTCLACADSQLERSCQNVRPSASNLTLISGKAAL